MGTHVAETESEEVEIKEMIPAKAYSVMMALVRYVLPALSLLWYGLSLEWGFDQAHHIYASISLVVVCLSSILGITDLKAGRGVSGQPIE